jgi:hypothetical protein
MGPKSNRPLRMALRIIQKVAEIGVICGKISMTEIALSL